MPILIQIFKKIFLYIIEGILFIAIKNIIIKRLFIMIDNSISYLLYIFSWNFGIAFFEIVEFIEKYRIKKGYGGKTVFDTKYEENDKILMALQIPAGTELNYKEMKKIFPKLSKNRIYEVIDIKKNIIPMYHEVFFKKRA